MQTPHSSLPSLRRGTAWWRRVPRRAWLGLGIAVLATAVLVWQHHGATTADTHTEAPPAVAQPPAPAGAPAAIDALAVGQLAPPTITTTDGAAQDAARATAQRFAANFATPNGDRDDWLARVAADVSGQLLEQYRLTDIRNVTQADVRSVDGPVRPGPGTLTFDAGYGDGSRIEIRLEAGIEGWKVINVVPLTGNGVRPAPDDVVEQSAPTSGEDHP